MKQSIPTEEEIAALQNDPETAAIIKKQEDEAELLVNAVAELFKQRGYDFVGVFIAKALQFGENVCSVGVNRVFYDPSVLPILPSNARSLRKVADDFDAAFEKGQSVEGIGHEHMEFEERPR